MNGQHEHPAEGGPPLQGTPDRLRAALEGPSLVKGTVSQPAAENVPMVANADGSTQTAVVVSPTQVRRPWRSTFRTAFQAFLALAVMAPVLVEATGLKADQWPWLAGVLGVAAAITRVMALPQVEDFLRRFLPFLAAAPAPPGAD